MIADERLISLKDLPKYLEARDGKRLALPTIYRWINSGLCGIRLEVIYLAGRAHTSVEALRRFDLAVTTAKLGKTKKITSTPTQVARAHERAKRKLAT